MRTERRYRANPLSEELARGLRVEAGLHEDVCDLSLGAPGLGQARPNLFPEPRSIRAAFTAARRERLGGGDHERIPQRILKRRAQRHHGPIDGPSLALGWALPAIELVHMTLVPAVGVRQRELELPHSVAGGLELAPSGCGGL